MAGGDVSLLSPDWLTATSSVGMLGDSRLLLETRARFGLAGGDVSLSST